MKILIVASKGLASTYLTSLSSDLYYSCFLQPTDGNLSQTEPGPLYNLFLLPGTFLSLHILSVPPIPLISNHPSGLSMQLTSSEKSSLNPQTE